MSDQVRCPICGFYRTTTKRKSIWGKKTIIMTSEVRRERRNASIAVALIAVVGCTAIIAANFVWERGPGCMGYSLRLGSLLAALVVISVYTVLTDPRKESFEKTT
jgi:peptidoglycan/LPS O-acetylase OafA/YrhL